MGDSERLAAIRAIRDRNVMGEGVLAEIADLAAAAPPELAAKLEPLVVAAKAYCQRNRKAIDELIGPVAGPVADTARVAS